MGISELLMSLMSIRDLPFLEDHHLSSLPKEHQSQLIRNYQLAMFLFREERPSFVLGHSSNGSFRYDPNPKKK